MKNITGVLGAALVVAFFLPWVAMGPMSFSGMQIVDLVKMAQQFASVSGESAPMETYIVYLLYFIPLFGAAMAYLDFTNKNAKSAALGAGIVTVFVFGWATVKSEGEMFEALSFGAYITALVGIISLLVGLGVVSTNQEEPSAPSEEASADTAQT